MPFHITFPIFSVPHISFPMYFLHFKTKTQMECQLELIRHFVSLFDCVAVFKSVFLKSVPGLLGS